MYRFNHVFPVICLMLLIGSTTQGSEGLPGRRVGGGSRFISSSIPDKEIAPLNFIMVNGK
jgi:hypothetical protein